MIRTLLCVSFLFLTLSNDCFAQRQMENLNRGLVAIKTDSNHVYIGWRLLGNDQPGTGFNLYRGKSKLNTKPIANATGFIDKNPTGEGYTVKSVTNGKEQKTSEYVSVAKKNYLSIPLKIPAGGETPDGKEYTYNANDASVGDLDGDGEYEIILKWEPSNAKDNSQRGYTGTSSSMPIN